MHNLFHFGVSDAITMSQFSSVTSFPHDSGNITSNQHSGCSPFPHTPTPALLAIKLSSGLAHAYSFHWLQNFYSVPVAAPADSRPNLKNKNKKSPKAFIWQLAISGMIYSGHSSRLYLATKALPLVAPPLHWICKTTRLPSHAAQREEPVLGTSVRNGTVRKAQRWVLYYGKGTGKREQWASRAH